MLEGRQVPQLEASPTEQQWLGNRATRRHPKKDPKAQKRSAIIGEFNHMERLMGETANEWSNVVTGHERNLTRIVYHGKPFIFRWLETRRRLPEFLDRAHFANLENPFVEPEVFNRYDPHDVFPQIIKLRRFGLFPILAPSFFDIEQMPLLRSEDGTSLAREDIKQVNLIFHDDKFNPETNQKLIIRQAMLYLVTQRLARPEEKIIIPDTLRPLHDRVLAYFDYYKDLLTNFDLDEWEESRLIRTLHWTGPFLPQALGSFITASLGITLQSAIKLFQTRAELSPMPTFIWRRHLLKALEFGAQDAYRINGLPKELTKYQHFDAQNDQVASKILSDHYQSLGLSEADLEDVYNKKFEWLDKFTELYFRHLRQDIARNPQRHLEINLAEHPIFSDVLVANQYANTLIFILRFRDGNTHLTLEIDKDQKLYGLPAKLISDNPHFMDLILGDLLPPVLEWARKHYPGVEPIKLSDYRKPEPVAGPVQKEEEPQYNPGDFVEYRKPRPKGPKILTPIAKLLEGPEPPRVVQPQAPQFVVFHSRERITEFLGKKVSNKVVDGLMREITDFEYGHSRVKALEDVGGLRELKYGDYRIIFRHEHNQFFSLVAIGRRGGIFRLHKIHPSRF